MSDKKFKGIKHDQKKPKMALLPFDVLYDVAKVLTLGAEKYSKDNWRFWDPNGATDRALSACLRHITEWQKGITKDLETGLPVLSHAICELLFMYYYAELYPHSDIKEDKI